MEPLSFEVGSVPREVVLDESAVKSDATCLPVGPEGEAAVTPVPDCLTEYRSEYAGAYLQRKRNDTHSSSSVVT